MTETAVVICVALCMFLEGELVEHTYKESMADCLKSRRIAQRVVNPESVIFSCKKLKVKTEIYMGGKKILKILKDE